MSTESKPARTRLTPAEARKARRLRRERKTIAEIAAEMHRAPSTISRALGTKAVRTKKARLSAEQMELYSKGKPDFERLYLDAVAVLAKNGLIKF